MYSDDPLYYSTQVNASACEAMPTFAALHCASAVPVVCTSNASVAEFPDVYNFSSALPVKGPSGAVLSPSWTTMLALGLDLTLDEAAVLEFCQTPPWSGCNAEGQQVENCDDFTTVSPEVNSTFASSDFNEPAFLNATVGACDMALNLVCLCFGGHFV